MVLELCVSDSNKQVLLGHRNFLPYVVDALLLDPAHPRAEMKEDLKAWCQQHHCEALAQLSVHEDSRSALLQEPSVVPALEAVSKTGLTEGAREFAASALVALRDKKLQMAAGGQKHVMLSCELIPLVASCDGLRLYVEVALGTACLHADQWNVQAAIQRTNESLIARGYATWFDLTNMKGSTMDAMSDAIEGADVMLYGVSLAYKESANCRLEANYAHQQELDMIPLMMQQDYKPQGWRKFPDRVLRILLQLRRPATHMRSMC